MSFTLQTGVTLDVPPVVVNRAKEGGPARAMSRAIGGQVVVTEIPQAQEKAELRLYIALMSDTQRLALETALNVAGPRTVYTGLESVTCVPAPRSEQKWESLVGGDYPDKDSGGSLALPEWQRQWAAEILYYRLS